MDSKEIFALRKQGQQKEALEMARSEFSKCKDDIWLSRAYGWALYDHVKQIVDKYDNNQLSASTMSYQISPYMKEFSNIASPLRGDSAFSQILRLANKVSRDWKDFLLFARWAGTESFSDQDKLPFVNNQGRKIDSLQKQFTRAICRETVTLSSMPNSDHSLIEWGQQILKDNLEIDPNDKWLNYYQSKLYLNLKELDQAITYLTPVLRQQPNVAWTWSLLGTILENDRPEDAITCLTHATQLAREEQEIANTRINLAHLLALSKRFEESAYQAKSALQYREDNKYKTPSKLAQLLSSDWYQETIQNKKEKPLAKANKEARSLLQSLECQSLTYIPGVIESINQKKALSYIAIDSNNGRPLYHQEFPEIAQLLPGTIIEVGRAINDGPLLDWRETSDCSLSGFCKTFSGVVERHEGKPFAFLRTNNNTDNVFIPPDMAHDFLPGEHYSKTCIALHRANKQGKIGWRVARFLDD